MCRNLVGMGMVIKSIGRKALLVLFALSGGATVAQGTLNPNPNTVVLTPTADVSVSEWKPKVTGDPDLSILRSGINYGRRSKSLIQFPTWKPGPDEALVSATLELYYDGSRSEDGGPMPLSIWAHSLDAAWNEGAATYTRIPAVRKEKAYGGYHFDTGESTGWKLFGDATAAVQDWIDTGQNFGVLLSPQYIHEHYHTVKKFRGRDYPLFEPRLRITFKKLGDLSSERSAGSHDVTAPQPVVSDADANEADTYGIGSFRLANAIKVETSTSPIIRLVWQPALGADSCQVQLSTSREFKPILRTLTTRDNMVTVEDLPPGLIVYWKVTAINTAGRRKHTGLPGVFKTTGRWGKKKHAVIPRGTPVIDGKMNEDEWKDAAELTLASYAAGSPSLIYVDPVARLFWDDKALYVACQVNLPDQRPIQATRQARDSSIWTEDALEVFVVPPEEKLRQYIVNAVGSVYDSAAGLKNWDGNCTVAVSSAVGKEKTTLYYELALPWGDFGGAPETGEKWRFNTCCDLDSQTLVPSWSDIRGGLFRPNLFGTIEFSGE